MSRLIEKRQEVIEELLERVIGPEVSGASSDDLGDPTGIKDPLGTLLRFKNGDKYRRLRDGDTTGYESNSEADMAYAYGLAWVMGNDPDGIEQLMRQSGLQRAKWGDHPTYLRDTILKAIASYKGDFYGPAKRFNANRGKTNESNPTTGGIGERVLVGRAITEGIEPPEELIEGVLLKARVHSVYAGPGSGKTWLALWKVAEVIKRGLPVVFFGSENGLNIASERLEALGVDPKALDTLFYYYPHPSLDLRPETVESYLQLLDEVKPALVVFDSWVNFLASADLDENSSVEVEQWSVRYALSARNRGSAVVILDHIPKDGKGSRGSGRKKDMVDVQWSLSNPKPFDRDTTGSIVLNRQKDREGWLPWNVSFSVGVNPAGGFQFVQNGETTEATGEDGLKATTRATLEVLRYAFPYGATSTDWLKMAHKLKKVSRASFHRAKRELVPVYVEQRGRIYYPKDPKDPKKKVSHEDSNETSRETSENADENCCETFVRPHNPPGNGNVSGSQEGLNVKMRPSHDEVSSVSPPYVNRGETSETGGTSVGETQDTHDNVIPFTRATEIVAVDCEIGGKTKADRLDPFKGELRLVTVCREGEEPEVFDTRTTDPREVLELLQDVDLIGHNLAFDLTFLKRYAAEHEIEWRHGELFDTMVLSQVIHAGRGHKHSLEACLQRELGIEINKEQQKSDWSKDLTEEQIEYAKNDVRYLGKLREALEAQVTNDLNPTVELERNLLPVLVDMKLRGVRVDVEGWRDALASIQEKYDKLTRELNDNYGEINWNSPSQILSKFKELGIPATKTDEGALKNLAKEHQVARDLLEHRKYKTLVQRYGKKWLEHVHDGRIHPNWKQTSTATGRMSCSEPNLQQIPRDGEFRGFFVPSGGMKFVVADYSQIELRIAAKLAEDEKMLDAFRQRQDLHKLTASMITGTPEDEVTKEQRQLAKALNFGLSFGMGAKRLKDYAKNNYEVELTVAEAEDYRKRWFDAYPNFREWHRNTEQKAKESGGKLDMCTFRGRVRNGVEGYSERFNFPVQGSGADGLNLALLRAAKAGLRPVLAVHDEIVCEVDASRAQEAKDQLERIMREAMLEALTHSEYPHVPIEVEPEVKDVWVK